MQKLKWEIVMARRSKPIMQWSYSALNLFETCAKKYYHLKVKKDVKDAPFDASNEGTVTHKHFEDRIKTGTPLPLHLKHHEPVLGRFAGAKGEVYAEQKMAINDQFQATGYFDADVWARAVIDYMVVNEDKGTAVIIDWKTGKVKEDFDQLDLFICFLAISFPNLEQYTASFYWTKTKEFTTKRVEAKDIPALWNNILPRIQRMETAIKTTDFPASPSGLCKKYCPVTSCVYHGKGSY
jgi:hypothetical protein